jgi:hypothetical protein
MEEAGAWGGRRIGKRPPWRSQFWSLGANEPAEGLLAREKVRV